MIFITQGCLQLLMLALLPCIIIGDQGHAKAIYTETDQGHPRNPAIPTHKCPKAGSDARDALQLKLAGHHDDGTSRHYDYLLTNEGQADICNVTLSVTGVNTGAVSLRDAANVVIGETRASGYDLHLPGYDQPYVVRLRVNNTATFAFTLTGSQGQRVTSDSPLNVTKALYCDPPLEGDVCEPEASRRQLRRQP